MRLLNKLERKFGKFAIPNLTMYLISMFIVGYVIILLINLGAIPEEFYSALLLNPDEIMKGEIWRLISWLIIPPSESIWWAIIVVMFYRWVGNSLEGSFGNFVYNLYVFSTIILTNLGVMIAYWLGLTEGYLYGNSYYLWMSMFLAFAVCYPELEVRLFFVLPVKVKYMGILDGILILITFIISSVGNKIILLMMMLTFIIFFLATRNYRKNSPKEIARRRNFKKKMQVAAQNKKNSVYKCTVCNRTEEDNPELEFRYCSKCKGGLAYCSEHLFTHKHVK